MSAHNDMVIIGLETLRHVAGEPITYHRGEQEITLDAIRGGSGIEDRELTREPAAAKLHTVSWRLELADLDDLTDPSGTEPDWIEDQYGDRYTVIRDEGDEDWEYITADNSWVRVTTYPDTPPTTTTTAE